MSPRPRPSLLHHTGMATAPVLTQFLFPGLARPMRDALCAHPWGQMNLLSMAVVVDPELKWMSLWLRVRWAAVLMLLVGSLLVLLLPLAAVEEQCQAVLKGLSFLKTKLAVGYVGITRHTGQTTGLSVTSSGLELLVLKSKPSPGKKWAFCT